MALCGAKIPETNEIKIKSFLLPQFTFLKVQQEKLNKSKTFVFSTRCILNQNQKQQIQLL